ncbi:MAG: hypothetical protein HC850_14950 [Rhodomicrobium sp.]|nr:hypothetical protein [Rhodomicrobium sp.]
MTRMEIVIFALSALCVIFVVVALAVPFAKAAGLPLPVVLASVGLTVAGISWATGIGVAGALLDAYNLWFIQSLALNSQSLLLIFLPPLLFEMSLGVNVRRLTDDVWTVFVMAVLAVLLATVTVAFAVWSLSTLLSLVACLLLGAAISTTDPAAVVTTFREIGAPRRLTVILEGESLLNDAAAITLFTLLIAIARSQDSTGLAIAGNFIYGFAVGAGAGLAFGWLASRLYSVLGGSATAEATLTLALAYGSFLFAEYQLGASGVVAVVFAGMTTRILGVVKMGPANWSTVMAVWTQIGFWANVLILLVAATMAPGMLFALKWQDLLLIPVVFVAAFFARGLILFGGLPLMSRFGLTAPMTTAQKTLICWGGVRGAANARFSLSASPRSGRSLNMSGTLSPRSRQASSSRRCSSTPRPWRSSPASSGSTCSPIPTAPCASASSQARAKKSAPMSSASPPTGPSPRTHSTSFMPNMTRRSRRRSPGRRRSASSSVSGCGSASRFCAIRNCAWCRKPSRTV